MWWNNGTNNISSNCPYFLFQLVLPVKPQDHDSNLIRIRKKLNEYRRWLIQWNLCNPTPEFSDILWRPTKIYGAKVFLLTKIKPGYSDIQYNPTHFSGPLLCHIRHVPLYIELGIMLHWCRSFTSCTINGPFQVTVLSSDDTRYNPKKSEREELQQSLSIGDL